MPDILYTYLDKEKHYFYLNEVLRGMPLGFQQKVLKYKKWENQQAALAGRMLLNTLIKTHGLNLSIEHLTYSSNLKPYFKNKETFFNISHTDDIVICALTNINEIGIGIEKLSAINIDHFKNMLTNNEWES